MATVFAQTRAFEAATVKPLDQLAGGPARGGSDLWDVKEAGAAYALIAEKNGPKTGPSLHPASECDPRLQIEGGARIDLRQNGVIDRAERPAGN